MVRLLERRFRVKAPLERAWRHLEQVEQWPTWARHIRRIDLTPSGRLTSNSAGALVLTNGIQSTFRMEELNPGANWKWAGRFLWITVHYDHQFRKAGPEETEIGFVLDGEGVAAGVFGRLFAAIYARNLDRAIPNLIQEIERDAGASVDASPLIC
jgi:Polyketide cyclase / dehydrase and lipid transport